MNLTPDTIIYWKFAGIQFSATIVNTWVVMVILICGSIITTGKFTIMGKRSRWQNFVESLVSTARATIQDITQENPDHYLSFIGTLFLFTGLSNLMAVIPLFRTPTSSFYTTSALATIVFFSVPIFGIKKNGVRKYLRHYLEPSAVMLPFTIIGEFSRTLAMAVRLFGNILSGVMISAILLSIIPFIFPVVFDLISILIGTIQAYILAILAAVYIESGSQS